MRFSLFTPTHSPRYLERLATSIKQQTFKDFEWIIVPNGEVRPKNIPEFIGINTKVIKYKGVTNNIGEIKSFCCNKAEGDILVEVDHDDELTPNALEELHSVFQNQNIDFAYSNCCEIQDGKPHVYSKVFGWDWRPFNYKGQQLLELLAFEPNPASFCKIWYAPNHVRAWKRSFYNKIGGHDKSMEVLDDHDLMCRTYIHGNVEHINKCLYIYHYHTSNTCMGKKNEFIQEETLNIHDKYIYPLVEKWCNLNNLRKIDLCGGFNCPKGYESIDLHDADIVADLNGRWPFEDNSVGVFRAHDALEHLRDPLHVMKEAYRCLAPNGWFLTFTPSTDGRGAFQDPTHVSFYNSNSFWYYTKKQQANYIGNKDVKFQMTRIRNFYPSEWHETHDIVYVKADMLKYSGRTPGEREI